MDKESRIHGFSPHLENGKVGINYITLENREKVEPVVAGN